jgi:hypothetical protein
MEPLTRAARHRYERHAPAAAARTGTQPPENVGCARLTCGQPSSRSTSNQVSPKREDHSQVRGHFARTSKAGGDISGD